MLGSELQASCVRGSEKRLKPKKLKSWGKVQNLHSSVTSWKKAKSSQNWGEQAAEWGGGGVEQWDEDGGGRCADAREGGREPAWREWRLDTGGDGDDDDCDGDGDGDHDDSEYFFIRLCRCVSCAFPYTS